jgi:hypothetical protein
MTMSAQARAEVTKLIDQKVKNVMTALTQEVSIDLDVISQKMLSSMGHDKSSDDLREEKRKLENYIGNINKTDLPEWAMLDERQDEVMRQFNVLYEELRTRQRNEMDELQAQQRVANEQFKLNKKQALDALGAQMTAIHHAAVNAEYPGTTDRLKEIETELVEVTKLERSIEAEVNRKAEAIEKFKARLQHLVRDKAADAQLQLLKCNSPEDAFDVVNLIPNVAELLSMLEDPEQGLSMLVQRLSTNGTTLQIAAPKFTVTQQAEEGLPLTMAVNDVEYEIVYVTDEA